MKTANLISSFYLALIIFCLGANSFFAQENRDSSEMDNPFGVLEFLNWNHPWNNYKYSSSSGVDRAVLLMQKAGIGWVRMDFLWEEIEPAKGNFQFAKYDEIVELVTRRGINILGVIGYCAPWASAQSGWNYPPEEDSDFVNYALRVISRYRSKVHYWEIWNEPDSGIYWAAQDGLSRYSQLLKKVYLAAKEAVPECKVLNGGLADPASSVGKLYENGAQGYFDALNIHIFVSPYNPVASQAVESYVKLVRKVMSRNGDAGKKIWVTEIGCPGVKRVVEINNWWLGKNPSETEQAKWLQQAYEKLLAAEAVEKVFWAFFRDCKDHWLNGTDYLGLLRWDFSQKPSFTAYKKVIAAWRNCRLKEAN